MRISLCTVCMNRAQHIKQTLERNILDNLDYEETEVILIDYNSRDDLETYVREELSVYIDSNRLTYYKTRTPEYFNRSHSRNIAFRLATGDIICNVDADNFTGPGFAAYLNALFESTRDQFFYANERFDVIGRIAVRKENFYKVGGFDERMVFYGFEDTDFMHRLMKSGLRPGVIGEKHFLSALTHSNKERMANEYVVNNFCALFVGYVDYASSTILVLFTNNSFFTGTLINRQNLHMDAPDFSDKRKEYDFTVGENKWLEGRWEKREAAYHFWYEGDRTLTLLPSGGERYRCRDTGAVYHEVTNKTMVEEALFFYSQLTNRMVFENNQASPEYVVNGGSFGRDTVYKNFELTPIAL
jgi:glycosyltransferase involved in cell wall biosynthesis